MATPIYNVPLLSPNSSERTLINTSISLEEALGSSLDSVNQNAPPSSPANGYKAIVGTTPTGAWTSFANHIAVYVDGWYFYPPSTKYGVHYTRSTPITGYKYDGTSWVAVASIGGGGPASSGHVILDETVTLPTRAKLAFVGTAVTATDDAANDKTIVTITGGSSGPQASLTFLPQATDPTASPLGTTLFARVDKNLYIRKSDGTVYPLTVGAAVPPIVSGVGSSGPVVGSQPPGQSTPYYKIIAQSGDGAYSGGYATRNGADVHIGWDATSTSYTLTLQGIKAAAGNVVAWLRTNGANATEAFLVQFYVGGVYLYKLSGSSYTLIATDSYVLPIGPFTITVTVNPTQIVYSDGIFSRTVADSTYASNQGVGFSLQVSDGTQIQNFPTAL